jgi:hypothetical protein
MYSYILKALNAALRKKRRRIFAVSTFEYIQKRKDYCLDFKYITFN